MALSDRLTQALSAFGLPKVGDLAPDFTAKDTDGVERTLSAAVKQGPLIVAFFPEAFTPG